MCCMTSGMALGDYIRTRRKQLRLSVSEAARRAGVHRVTWNSWESGKSEPGDYNHAAIEAVLQWQDGGMDRLKRGEVPELLKPSESSAEPAQAGNPFALILDASLEELFAMTRTMQADQRYGALGAEKWLADALELRRRARLYEEGSIAATKSEHG